MKITAHRFINTECIGLSFQLDWNYDLAIEIDFIQWRIDIIFIEGWKRKAKTFFKRTIESLNKSIPPWV